MTKPAKCCALRKLYIYLAEHALGLYPFAATVERIFMIILYIFNCFSHIYIKAFHVSLVFGSVTPAHLCSIRATFCDVQHMSTVPATF